MPEDLFKIQRYCLRVMGHNLDVNTPTLAPQRRALRQGLYYAQLLVVVSAQWPLLNYVKHNIGDMELATSSFSVFLTNFLSAVKIATFLRYKPQFTVMLQRIIKLNDEMHDTEAKASLNKANGVAKRFAVFYTVSCAGTGVYFHILPIVKIIWCIVTKRPITMELPIPMKFAFDEGTSPWYELVFCYTAAVTLVVVMYACAVDGFFFVFVMNICGHLQALQRYIASNIHRYHAASGEYQSVSDLVQYHVLILELAAGVQEIFMPVVFCQFLMTSLSVCVVIFQMVSNLNSVMVMLNYATFLAAILWQLFIYCYGGEMLKEHSLMVSTAVKYSNWHELRPQQRRMLLFLIKRAQRELIIKAGFYEASLANFLAIIQAAISYITIIQSIE